MQETTTFEQLVAKDQEHKRRITDVVQEVVTWCQHIYPEVDLTRCPIRYGRNGSRSYGRWYFRKLGNDITTWITMNPGIGSEHQWRRTMKHELAHEIAFRLRGNQDDAHGYYWGSVMLSFGLNPYEEFRGKELLNR